MRLRKPNLEWLYPLGFPARDVGSSVERVVLGDEVGKAIAGATKQKLAKAVVPAIVKKLQSLNVGAAGLPEGWPSDVQEAGEEADRALAKWGGGHQQARRDRTTVIDGRPYRQKWWFVDPRNRKRIMRTDPDHFHILFPQSNYDD